MNDRTILRIGGKAIRFQRFAALVLFPTLAVGTLCNFHFGLGFDSGVIALWLILALAYTVAEGVKRLVIGQMDIPKAGE
jgi:hypothetical protein